MFIREFDESTDMDGLKACFIELQDFERNLISSMPKGADICDVSIAETLKECKRFAGKILLAIENDTVAGYAVIHTRMVSDDVSDGDMEYGYISELAVLEAHRQKGYGKKLLANAEQVGERMRRYHIENWGDKCQYCCRRTLPGYRIPAFVDAAGKVAVSFLVTASASLLPNAWLCSSAALALCLWVKLKIRECHSSVRQCSVLLHCPAVA